MEQKVADNSLIEVIEVDPKKVQQDLYSNMIEVIEEEPFAKSNLVQICCLIEEGVRCKQASGNASFNKRVQKTVEERDLKLIHDAEAHHNYICDYHKILIQSLRLSCKTKGVSGSTVSASKKSKVKSEPGEVDFTKLQLNSLRRYKNFFNVPTKSNVNKAQLAEAMQNHFKTIPVDEKEILSFFIYSIKTNSNQLDHASGGPSSSFAGFRGDGSGSSGSVAK